MIRYPNITGKTDAQKLEQIKSYLHQLVGELNYQLKQGEVVDAVGNYASSVNGGAVSSRKTDPISTFNDIKSLIINSVDIINAYYDEISKRLEGVYATKSEFSTYTEQNNTSIQTIVSNMEQIAESIQHLTSALETLEQYQSDMNAHINTDLLGDDGEPVYGLEIGQRTEAGGFDKFARFTSNGLDVPGDTHLRGEVRIGASGVTLREYIMAVISEGG